MITRIILIAFSIVLPIHSAEKEIRYLKPPKLDHENILEKVLCHRPRREGQPNIDREKNIIHNYGHGSGGWTMSWGAAKEAVSFLSSTDVNKNFVIVGGGVSGLTVAYTLVKQGYKPKAVIAREFDNLTSHKAGGLFAHQSTNPDKKIRKRVNDYIIQSCEIYKKIAQGKHTDFKEGVRELSSYFKDRQSSDLEICVEAGLLKPAKEVIGDFQNGTRRELVVYDDNVFINTPTMMHNLRNFLVQHKVTFLQEEVKDFQKIPYADPIVFNCTGLGARELVVNEANSMMPVQGHLLLLKDQDEEDLNYTLELELSDGTTEDGMPMSHLCYIFPKKLRNAKKGEIGVVGGTFIKNADANNPHAEEFEHVRKNTRVYCGVDKS